MLTFIREKLTYHHIEKVTDGGPTNADNGALLVEMVHKWLHNNVERCDIGMYRLINDCLKLYKICVTEERQELLEQWELEVVPEFQKGIADGRIKQKTL